jgi:DNA-binding transcriptional LysR family regulator
MHLTLRQLQVFDAVARHRNFTRAAEELFMTQPAVSGHVRQMEELAEVPLLERVGRRLDLTQAGEEVQATARAMLQRLEDLDTALAELQGLVRGRLRLSVVTTAEYFAPHLLGAFSRQYAGVDIRLEVSNREHVLARLADNEDELAVMGRVPEGVGVTGTPFLDNPLVVLAPPDHPLVGASQIPLERLAEEPVLLREPGSGTRLALERHFAEAGLTPRVAMELGSNEAIKQAVLAGLGVSVLSRHTLTLELASGRLSLLDVAGFPLERQWYAVHLENRRLSVPAHTFLEFLRREGPQLIPGSPAVTPRS